MDRKCFAFAVASVVGLSLQTAPSFAQMRWDMPTEQSQSSLTGIADLAFADLVREKTDGEIDVTVHFGGSLGYDTQDQYDAVGTGALVLADSYTGPLVGFDPIWQVSALPFLTNGIDEAWKLYQAAKPYYEEILDEENQVLLYTIPWSPSGIWAGQAITTTKDLKGLKIRTYDPLGQMTFEAAGAAPVTMTFADVIPQLTTGGIEAVLTSAEGGFRNKFQDLLSDFTAIEYASPLSIVHINKDVWESLTKEQRHAIRDAATEVEKMIWERAKTRDQENFVGMQAAGVTVTEDPSRDMMATLQEAASGAITEWKEKAGEQGRAILEGYRGAGDGKTSR